MNLHGPVRAPVTTGAGTAVVTISFDAWTEGGVTPTVHALPVAAARPGPKLEPVSARLKATLIHPNRNGMLCNLRYLPGGQRLLAGDYPGGTVQTWDATTGKQLPKVETGRGYHGSTEYFAISPDGTTLYAPREMRKGKMTRVEKDGKKFTRWEFDSDVRAWDLASGELRATFKHDPPRNVLALKLSPDGSFLLTQESLPGETEGQPNQACSIWDVRTKRSRALPAELGVYGAFSPDGKTVATVPPDASGYENTIKIFDIETGKEKLVIPTGEQATFSGVWAFTSDGRAVMGFVQAFPKKKDWSTYRYNLKVWDAATGKELMSFAAPAEKVYLREPVFAPGGRMFCCVTQGEDRPRLLIFDAAGWKLARTVFLADKPPAGERLALQTPAFSPDGRWLAVMSQNWPENLRSNEPAASELSQPRIHLIDAVTGEVRETLIAPQGAGSCVCFSPDGKTLASGGSGRVYLWDFTKPPGE